MLQGVVFWVPKFKRWYFYSEKWILLFCAGSASTCGPVNKFCCSQLLYGMKILIVLKFCSLAYYAGKKKIDGFLILWFYCLNELKHLLTHVSTFVKWHHSIHLTAHVELFKLLLHDCGINLHFLLLGTVATTSSLLRNAFQKEGFSQVCT